MPNRLGAWPRSHAATNLEKNSVQMNRWNFRGTVHLLRKRKSEREFESSRRGNTESSVGRGNSKSRRGKLERYAARSRAKLSLRRWRTPVCIVASLNVWRSRGRSHSRRHSVAHRRQLRVDFHVLLSLVWCPLNRVACFKVRSCQRVRERERERERERRKEKNIARRDKEVFLTLVRFRNCEITRQFRASTNL